MAIWSMGSQTQILIGYLPVPAPLLCKYWTSTFFTVTCIWKKKKSEESQRAVVGGWGGDVENRHGWVDLQRANSPRPPFIISQLPPSSYPQNLQPTSATHTLFLRPSGQRKKVCRSWCIRVIVHCRNCLYWGWFKKKIKHLILDQLDIN